MSRDQTGDEASITSGAPASAREGVLDAEALFREYYPRVYAYIRYRIADMAEAEDLCCAVIERAWTYLPSYDAHKGAFSTWLFRIAHNTFVNYVKQQQRRQRHHVDLQGNLEDLASNAPSPEQEMLRREEQARLMRAVRRLSLRQQEILALRFAGSLTNRDIARVLEMNERTVSVTILRALRKLRAQIARTDDANRSVKGEVK
jgi:RNA polymerase sigma factor (sigma-70 family)